MDGLRAAAASMVRVIRNRDIRRSLLAWLAGNGAEWAWLVALFVYAFDSGGLAVVGLVGLARTLPAAILAPALGSVADRFPRHRVLLVVDAGRCLMLTTAALAALAGWSPFLVYALAALDGLLAVLHRPAYMSMLPSLARSPDDLVGANVASSTVEAVGILGGPVLGGLLVATGAPALTFAAPAVLLALAVVSISGVRPAPSHRAPSRSGVGETLFGGLRAVAAHPHAALLLGLFSAQTLVRGVLSVLIVAGAVQLLAMGHSGVGYLNAAIGAGGLVGAVAALALVGRARMAPGIVLGMVLWGLPIFAIGLAPAAVVALASLAVLGAGNAILDVAGFSLLQRSVPNAVRGRVFAILESLVMLTVGIGAALAPILVDWLGVQGAWIATGLVLPLLGLASWRALARADSRAVIPARELALLRGVPMLRVLPMTILEQLASDLEPVRFAAREPIIREGDVGDRFYIIDSGQVEVRIGDRVIRREGPGESFGEVALLRDVPRTAGVFAASDTELFALGREAFTSAVTGDYQSLRAADEVIDTRLATG